MATKIRVPKDFDLLVDQALAEGWTLARTGKGHLKLVAPDGKGAVYFANSPSDNRARHRFRTTLRRAGVSV